MIVLGIDPGAKGAGYCVWDSEQNAPVYIGSERPLLWEGMLDAIVVESGFIGKMGRQAMWGLGFDASWRMCEIVCNRELRCKLFTIRPDGVNGWRAALPPKPGGHQRYDGLPGEVIVARLRHRYQLPALNQDGSYTEHEVEACGIAEAAAAILARPKAKDRKALKAVKR